MRAQRTKGMRWGVASRLGLAVLTAALTAGAQPAAAQAPAVGLACTTGPSFNLSTSAGYINLPDGNTMYMLGYTAAGQPFQHPGPVLCVTAGDPVTINLLNDSPEDVSIVFPGQENVMANGAPAQPQFDGTGKLTSLTNVAPRNGGSVTYSFVAGRPGTFLYQSGTEPQKQVRMGYFGALVVRPKAVPSRPAPDPAPGLAAEYGFDRTDSRFTPAEEFMVLLSEIDPYQHQAAEAGQPFNITLYHPRYWLVNGRGFPDAIADNYAPWLPSQPYGALARIHGMNTDVPDTDPNYHPYPGLIRYLSVGSENYPFHPHGNNGLVIGRDGWPLEGSTGQDLTFEKFAINIGPGQTWDVSFKWHDAEGYASSPASKNVPVTSSNVANLVPGMFYSGSPYLGETGPLPPGVNTLNQCGEFYIISHNHALYQITSWGVNMSGPITYLRIDPPLPNTCP